MSSKKIFFHKNDLPNHININYPSVAIDTEAMGLNLTRDRLCLIQLNFGSNESHLVQIDSNNIQNYSNLINLLESDILTIFHFARFDLAMIFKTFGIMPKNIYCTKIASKLARTYSDRHGLKTICSELLGVDISKKQQASDWGQNDLSEEQKDYAATDVIYLHDLMHKLNIMLKREHRMSLAKESFEALKTVVKLDLSGWSENLFSHL